MLFTKQLEGDKTKTSLISSPKYTYLYHLSNVVIQLDSHFMIKHFYQTLQICLLMLCASVSTFAQGLGGRVIGADLTYKSLGGNTYEVTLNAYRDCASTSSLNSFYAVNYLGVAPTVSGSIIVNQVSVTEVSISCAGQATICEGGSLPGTRKHTYVGTVTLPHKSPRWMFSWQLCSRSPALTTVVLDPNPAVPPPCVYIEAFLNNLSIESNNSPTFSSEPTVFICTNQSQSFNLGAVQPDAGQSLRYSLVRPRVGSNGELLNYKQGFSATQFLSSTPAVSIDPITGTIGLTPTAIEVGTTALLVEEFVNGVLVGSVMRDFQISTRSCNNDLPVASGMNGTNSFSTSTCAGTPVQFTINGSDPDAGQIVSLSWNQGITGASFSPSGSNATFNWNPTNDDAGIKSFVVTVKDNACPVPGVQTYSYSVEVFPKPSVKLRNDTTIACDIQLPITANMTGGTPPFTYLWSPGGEVTPSISKGIGTYSVTVTDSKGCTATAGVGITRGITVDFSYDTACVGKPVKFKDLSTSVAGNITNWSWNFDDPGSVGNTSTIKNPSHTFNTPGLYDVRLRARDNTGCERIVSKVVKVCGIPKADFIYMDSCQLKPLTITGIPDSSVSCPITTWILKDDRNNSQTNSTGNFAVQYADSGIVKVTLTVYNANGCGSFIEKEIRIYPRPFVNILDTNYYFRCSQPDSTIKAISYARPKTKLYKLEWSNNNQIITGLSDTVTSLNTLSASGIYTVRATDTLGCVCQDNITVIKPLTVGFNASKFCEAGDTIRFTNTSDSHWGIKSYKWKLGNGQIRTTKDVKYRYPQLGVYQVTLIVIDSTNCSDSLTKTIINVLPTGNFAVTINSPTDTICFGDAVTYQGPQGQYVNSWTWKFTDNDSVTVTTAAQSGGSYTFNQSGCFDVKLRLLYNDDGTGACVRNYKRKVCVRAPFQVSATHQGICAGAPTTFQGTKTSGDSEVASWAWQFFQVPASGGNPVQLGSSNVQNPSFTFRRHGAFIAKLQATDKKGCKANTETSFNISDVAKPYFVNEGLCVGQPIRFSISSAADTFENVTVYKYVFGDGDELTTNTGQAFHAYNAIGAYSVRLLAYSQDGCADSSITVLNILNAPVGAFTSDTVCNKEATIFRASLASADPTATYKWFFGDGVTDTTGAIVKHKYAGAGTFNARLVITSASGCQDTITNQVVVKRTPIAKFGFSGIPIAKRPITFVDSSSFATKWVWTFEPNQTPVVVTDTNNRNVSHTYAEPNVYKITQIATSVDNCSDTTSIEIDLNSYFALPTAYSPNGDGMNDRFRVRGKAIKQLTDFKIYNRWGQIVFDASGDLQKGIDGWDGKFNGVQQPAGVYVVYAAIKTEYGQEIILKGNLTLLR
jgi:gliding motility-associated-like protein